MRNLLRSTCRLFDRESHKQATQKGDAVVRIRSPFGLRLVSFVYVGAVGRSITSAGALEWGRLSAGTPPVVQPLFCQMVFAVVRCFGLDLRFWQFAER